MDNYKGQICRTRMITFFGVNQQFAVQICVFEMLKKLTSIQLAIWSPVCYFWYEEQTWWQLLSFRCLSLGCCLFPNGRPTGCAAVWCSVYSQRPCFTLRRVSDGEKKRSGHPILFDIAVLESVNSRLNVSFSPSRILDRQYDCNDPIIRKQDTIIQNERARSDHWISFKTGKKRRKLDRCQVGRRKLAA